MTPARTIRAFLEGALSADELGRRMRAEPEVFDAACQHLAEHEAPALEALLVDALADAHLPEHEARLLDAAFGEGGDVGELLVECDPCFDFACGLLLRLPSPLLEEAVGDALAERAPMAVAAPVHGLGAAEVQSPAALVPPGSMRGAYLAALAIAAAIFVSVLVAAPDSPLPPSPVTPPPRPTTVSPPPAPPPAPDHGIALTPALVRVRHGAPIRTVAWRADDTLLATGGEDEQVLLWKPDGTLVRTLSGHEGWVLSVRWAPDGRRLLSVADDERGAVVWDTETGASQALYLIETVRGLGRRWAEWQPGGDTVVTGGWGVPTRLVTQDPLRVVELSGHQKFVRRGLWRPDGEVVSTVSRDGTARLWDADGRELAVLGAHHGWVSGQCWSSDGDRLATTGEDSTVRIWTAKGEPVRTLEGAHVADVETCAWHPNGRQLVTGGTEPTAYLWDVTTGESTALPGHDLRVNAVHWSHDGRYLATMDISRQVRVWNARGKPVARLMHRGKVRSIRWAHRSLRIATVGDDATLRLFDLGD